MSRDPRRVLAFSVAAVAALTGVSASGAEPQAKDDAIGKMAVSQDLSSMQAARTARALAKKGECAKALDEFDAALRTVEDPELHRERGLCHEREGHPYPAIDDFRYYLTALPNGKYADDTRARLARLEGQPSGGEAGASEEAEPGTESKGEGEISVSAHADSAQATASSSAEVPDDKEDQKEMQAPAKSFSESAAEEKRLDAAKGSPLRLGRGFALGPVFGVRRWFSDALGWSENFAASFRYSFGSVSTVHVELGYMSVGGTGTASSLGGLSTFLGYEARVRLDRYATNALVAGVGGGYERLSQGAVGSVFSTFEGRGELGLRHVFGPSLGLELVAQGGLASFSLVDAPSGTDSVTKGFLGGRTGLIVGF